MAVPPLQRTDGSSPIDTLGRVEGFIASAAGFWGGPGTFAFSSNVTILDTVAWHHIVVIFDRSGNSSCRLYIDGLDVSSNRIGDINGVGSLGNMADLRIGSEADGECQWRGSIDECIVSYTVRSPEWVKLCYMNQGGMTDCWYFENYAVSAVTLKEKTGKEKAFYKYIKQCNTFNAFLDTASGKK